MIQIGPYQLDGPAVLAPMAGVTDFPFRQICKKLGASMVTAEMSASNPLLRKTQKSMLRLAHPDDTEPRTIQIVGTEPRQMADAAIYQVQSGAQIIDINMGCPAKKVCKKLAGSALLKDEHKVAAILTAVVASVDVPVTLKIRTGWDLSDRNAVSIAKMAESIGIQSLAVHGRTRACRFQGPVEYDTIGEVAQAVDIPVFANGDITSATKAKAILDYTGANGIMIGRAAQGKPWIFQEIKDLLSEFNPSSELFTAKSLIQGDTKIPEHIIIDHLCHIHRYYNSTCFNNKQRNVKNCTSLAVKIARKHISWYFEQFGRIIHNHMDINDTGSYAVKQEVKRRISNIKAAKKQFNQLDCPSAQLDCLQQFFGDLHTTGDIAA